MNNKLDYKKIQSICDQIDKNTNDIFDYVIQLSKLIETIPSVFQDAEVKKMCELIQNEQILKMKKENDKIALIKNVLTKIMLAYEETDQYYSNKKIFE